jgi:hypothetical protein
MAEPKYWFGLSGYRYLAWHQLTLYRRHAPGSTLEDAFAYLRPDILIVDAEMDWQITDDPSTLEPWAQLQYLPKSEWEAFLQRRARLVTTIDTRGFGPIRIYRIQWE